MSERSIARAFVYTKTLLFVPLSLSFKAYYSNAEETSCKNSRAHQLAKNDREKWPALYVKLCYYRLILGAKRSTSI